MDNNYQSYTYSQVWPFEEQELQPIPNGFYVKAVLKVLLVSFTTFAMMAYFIRETLMGHLSSVVLDVINFNGNAYCTFVSFAVLYKMNDLVEFFIESTKWYDANKADGSVAGSVKFYDRFVLGWVCYIVPSILVPGLINIFLDGNCPGNDNALTRAVAVFVAKKPICGMMYNIYVPFEYDHYPTVKMLLNAYQFATTCIILAGGCAISSAILEAANFIVLRLKQLKRRLRTIFREQQFDDLEKRIMIADWIQTHQSLLYHFDLFRNCYKWFMFGHVAFTGVSVALLVYVIFMHYQLILVCYLSGYLITLGLACMAGYRVTIECEKLVDALNLDITWHKQSIKMQHILNVILIRSQKSLVLNAGPFSTLSPEFFLKIIRSSYSFLTLLINTNHTT